MNEAIRLKEIEIKEHLGCFRNYLNKPNYLDKLNTVKFYKCKLSDKSDPVNFIRLTDNLITSKRRISGIEIIKEDFYVLFSGSKSKKRVPEKRAVNIMNELGLEVK